MPAARGAEAEVPVWVPVQSLCRSALVCVAPEGGEHGRTCEECDPVPGGNHTEGRICYDQETELIRFPASFSKPQTDACHLLIC